MGSAKVRFIPLLICLAGVFAFETAAYWVKADSLTLTAFVRLLDICLVLGTVYIFHQGLNAIGLARETVSAGIWHGLFWSAGFGALVLVTAGILYLGGAYPLSLIQVQMPGNTGRLVLYLITGGIIGPIAEEMVFRGLVYGFLRQWGILIGLIGSTAFFVLVHQAATGIPVLQIVGGLVFAMSYEASKSLLTPIVIHILGNLALSGAGLTSLMY